MRLCRDCVDEFGEDKARKLRRPASHPGPRCTSHHRAVVRVRKARAHELMVQRVYGLGPGDYDRLLAFQGGKCWICRRATGRVRRLAVDHDHKTGKPRGILCSPCNRLLGHVRDDPTVLIRAAEYLTSPPARVLDAHPGD